MSVYARSGRVTADGSARIIRVTRSGGIALLVTVLAAFWTVIALVPRADATAGDAASLAAANIGKTAGTCAVNPTHNTLGGDTYETSCYGGYSGGAEYWCADFARWVWANSGFNVGGLTAAAQSFVTYGQTHGTSRSTPAAGDAIVFSSSQGGYADHVAIVTAVHSDGSITTANGDWGGDSGTMAHFAETSSVVSVGISARSTWVGSYSSGHSYYITAIVAPSGSGGGTTGGSNPYSPAQVCGSGYGVIDSHALTGATIYLLYDDSTGDNCVVTMAASDLGAVTMNATLSVQGGSSGSNPGNFHWYAGPVAEHAPNSCVKWGGTYKSSTWTSSWSHCGGGGSTPPPVQNPYSPTQVCGSGYSVIDHHTLTGATVYLLWNGSDNCVVTLTQEPTGAHTMNATLSVQGGSSGSNPGSFTYYAGPVRLPAAGHCVEWGGTNGSSSWTSGWAHCG